MVGAGAMETAYAGLETLARKMGVKSLTPISPSGLVTRVGQAGRTAAEAETFGRGTTGVIEKAIAPMVGKLQPYAQEAMETFQRRGRSAVLPSEVSTSRLLGVAENVAEGSVFGGGAATAVRQTRQAIAEQKVMDVLGTLGPSTGRRAVGQAVQRALPESPGAEAERAIGTAEAGRASREGARSAEREALQQHGQAAADTAVGRYPSATPAAAGVSVRAARATAIKGFRDEEKVAWKKFTDAASTIPMTAPKLDAFIAQLQGREAGAILPNAGVQAAKRVAGLLNTEGEGEVGEALRLHGGIVDVSKLSPDARKVIASMHKGGDAPEAPVTVAQFQKTVSDLGRLMRALEKSAQTDPSKYNAQLGLAKRLYGLAREDMEAVLEETSPDALAAYTEAMGLSRVGNERLFNAQVRQVTRQAPEKVTQSLLRPNNSTAITLTTEAAGDTAMLPVRRIAMEKILEPDPVTKTINWKSVVRRLNTLGPDTLKALFPRGEAEGVLRVADSIVQAQRLLDDESKGELAALGEARAAAKAGRETDAFSALRDVRRPERIVSRLFQAENVSAVESVHQILGDQGFEPVQRTVMEMVVRPNPKTGAIDWKQVIGRLDRVDDETLRAFYPKGQAQEVTRIAKLMLRLQQQHAGGVGKVGIMLTQWGAVAGLLAANLNRGAATVLLLPPMIARVFANPIGLKWLTTGLESPAWSPQAMRAVSQLTAFLLQDAAQKQGQATPQQKTGTTP